MFLTEAVTFECNITGMYSNWHFRWYKDGKAIDIIANSRLTIGSAAESDTGSYSCQGERAQNPNYTKISEARNITVSASLPRLSLTSPETDAYEGENFSLTCEVKGGTQGWKYDFFKGSPHDAIKHDSELMVYTIQEVTVSDSNTYWCQARRGPPYLKLNFSNSLTLKVQERPTAEITSVRGWSDVFKNEKLVLQCTGDKKYDDWSYWWYKNGEELQEGHGSGMANGNTWSIDLINESHRGTYVCRGERSRRPMYTQRSKPFNVTNDDWSYRWYKNGEELQEGHGSGMAKGNTWSIDLINESHRGTYVCKGERSRRPMYTQRSKPFNVTVREKPPNTALILKPQQTLIFEGDMMTLSCEVKDSPAAGWRFWWFTNSNKSSIPTICKDGSRESKCTIQSVTLSYTAEYWCRAGRGEPPFYLNSSRPVVLQVHVAFDKPVLSPLTQWSVWIGQPISLHCKTQLKNTAQRGHLRYRFYRNGTVWTQPGSQETLTISSAEISDTGLYSCEVEAMGTNVKKQSDTVNVRVTDRPKLFLTMRPSWQTVYYGETVTLSCQMNIDIPGLQYQWYKDGKRSLAPYAVGHIVESHIYTISAIVWSDQGEYKCQAHTGKPSIQSYTSRPLVLNITEHPEVSFLQWPTWTVLFAGEKLTLNCRVNGDPQIKKFRWFMATANHLRRNLSCENIPGCSITFSDKNQSGLYWCETESGEKRSKAVSFTVTADMVALQTPPLPLTEGDDVTLECRTRYPTSHMTKVYHEDQEMQPSVWYTRVKKEHEGRYKCVVFSRQTLVASSEEVNITVRDFFSSVMLTSVPGLSVKEEEMVKLTCEVKNNSLQKLPVHYSFLKDGVVLSEGENITYTIMKMNESHAGNYTTLVAYGSLCRRERPGGSSHHSGLTMRKLHLLEMKQLTLLVSKNRIKCFAIRSTVYSGNPPLLPFHVSADRSLESGDADPNSPPHLNERRAAFMTSAFHKVRNNSRMSRRKKSLRRTLSEHHYEEI
ncbi:FCRL5 protein, partial [Polypterus senegalus]|nr:FCRL5 protein [Polypterus senegalus]